MNIQVPAPNPAVRLSQDVLDQLMPMHVLLDDMGTIRHLGPTCSKMLAGQTAQGGGFFDHFYVRRPVGIKDIKTLRAAQGERLFLVLKGQDDLLIRAVAVEAADPGWCLLDLSFGLSFAQAVARFSLTLTDFAITDQTVEMLYLNEAKATTTRMSEQLSQRLQTAHETAQAQARTDVLTGLSNRRAMDDELEHLLAGRNQEFTLMQLDLDLFKQVNDTHGHAAGDAVLVEIGRILDQELRRNDFPARIGGDEFLIVLRPAQSKSVLSRIAGRIIRRIEKPISVGPTDVRISASIGIVSTTSYVERPSLNVLMADVDTALYDAKHRGRGRFSIFNPRKALNGPARGGSQRPNPPSKT